MCVWTSTTLARDVCALTRVAAAAVKPSAPAPASKSLRFIDETSFERLAFQCA
jgi:hypothetical protein